jgi:3D (Asp-Asp-Asp) domain-containing protein
MNLKKLLVANMVISSVALATSGVAIGITQLDSSNVEQVVYECTCPVEEVTEAKVETTAPIKKETTKTIEATTTTKVIETTEPTEVVEPHYLGEFKLTAYCACENCCGKTDGITASGTIATEGRTIAVDPTVIPYGTEVTINGNTYVAEDCGGAIDGNRIDVYFDSHSEAWDFGVQYADVYLAN